MIVVKYIELLRIRFTHEYYSSGECTDFALVPSQECRKLMRANGLKFRVYPDGGGIWYRADGDGVAEIDLTELVDGTRFTFYVTLRNPALHRFTSLGLPANKPDYDLRTRLFYFDSDDGQETTDGGDLVELNLLPGAAGPVSDDLPNDVVTVSGGVREVLDNSEGTTDTSEILEASDDSFATLSATGDYIELELMDTIPDGEDVVFRLKGEKATVEIDLEGSYDGETYVSLLSGEMLSNSFDDYTVSIAGESRGMRYFRLTNTVDDEAYVAFASYSFSLSIPNEPDHNIPGSVLFAGSQVAWSQDDANDSGQLEVFGPDADLPSPLFSAVLDNPGTKFSHSLSLSGYPEGLYTFRLTAGAVVTDTTIYVSDALQQGSYFGVIDLRKSSWWEDVVAGDQEGFECTLKFTPRKSVWRYFLVLKNGSADLDSMRLRDDEDSELTRYPRLSFTDVSDDVLGSAKQFQGLDARVWKTVYVEAHDPDDDSLLPGDQPSKFVRYFEEGNPEINLYASDSYTELLRADLPGPAPGSQAFDPVDDEVTYSDVFIYV